MSCHAVMGSVELATDGTGRHWNFKLNVHHLASPPDALKHGR